MQKHIRKSLNLPKSGLPSPIILLLLLALTWTSPSGLFAAAPEDSADVAVVTPSPSPLDTMGRDVVAVGEDFLHFVSSPARWDWKGWTGFGGTVVGTALITTLDDPIRKQFLGDTLAIQTTLGVYGNSLGTVIPSAVVIGTLYTGGLIFDNRWMRLTGRHVFQSVLYATVITVTVKTLLGRHRPDQHDGPYAFEGPSFRDEFNSLPSGHTTVAFALCSSLAADIDHPVATVVLYTMAAYTGFTRMYDDRHWSSDVFLGAIVGTVCGYTVANMHVSADGRMGWRVVPTVNGLAVSGVF